MKLRLLFFLGLSLSLTTFYSCQNDSKSTEKKTVDTDAKGDKKGNASVLKVGDKLFNIPSPLETAVLLEKVGGSFNETLLNSGGSASDYTTKQAQALNLGVFGADLGYALIYGQSQKAFGLLATCKKLGTELGISPALYTDLMKRFEGNMENRDSLLLFVSELNRLSDQYLKENESEDISAMILAGGWLESLHFALNLYEATNDELLRKRIAEQNGTIKNLIGLLKQENESGSLDDLISSLSGLESTYASVNSTYEYVEPETDAAKKITVIKSKTTTEMTDETLQKISEQVESLRKEITGKSES